jgi:hypothetical protein
MYFHGVRRFGNRDPGVQWEDVKVYSTINGMSQKVPFQRSTSYYDEVFCCRPMFSPGRGLEVGVAHIGSTRSSQKCHRSSFCSVLPRGVSQSWVLQQSIIPRHRSNACMKDLRSSMISPECLCTTRGLAPTDSAGEKI